MFGLPSFSPVCRLIYSQSARTLVTCSINQGTGSLLLNNSTTAIKPVSIWSLDIIRTVVRNHFPYPRETKRVKTHGWKKRMSTREGRVILMRRILKGRHVLSH